MTGAGNTSHNAEIHNGQYTPGIGTTTLKVFCNDNEGFTIYANGYTNQEDGNNLLINSALSNNNTIATGTATSGDTSNWAMMLTKKADSGDTTGENALTIDSAPNTSGGADATFSAYHNVPTEFTKVAHKNSSTDMNETTGGATLETTYAAYINQTQPAGTYSGKVKYVLVHPSTAEAPVNEDQVGITYNGNGLTFANGASKNRVIYGTVPMYEGTTATIAKTRNIDDDGTTGGIYSSDEIIPVTISGADKVKVILKTNYSYADLYITPHYVDYENSYEGDDWIHPEQQGEETFIFNGDTVSFAFYAYDAPETGHGYGFYAQIYPLYTTEQAGTVISDVAALAPDTGTYATTTTWKGKWYITSNNETTFLENEAAVINYLEQNSALLGTNVNIYAYNPYTIIYNGNNATAGTMTGFTTKVDTTSSTADLMAPNFKRTGYGFAGWSEDSSAKVNSSSKIYGPNEKVVGSDLSFNSSTRETTMYAVWVPTSGNMQSFSCSSLGSNQITALTDTRDGNVYTVGKMQDGNCWMMENLRLDNTATINSTNTNSPISTFTALPATSDSWCTGYNAYCVNQPLLNTNNTNIGGNNASGVTLIVTPGLWNGAYYDIDQANLGNSDHSQWFGYGNYYNWYSATAGNGTYSKTSGNTSGDLCPAGWKLPNGGADTDTNGGATSGGFSYLDIQMGGTGSWQSDDEDSNRWRSFPNNFVYSGEWDRDSTIGNWRGELGMYPSRTATNNNHNIYALTLTSQGIYPGTSLSEKYYGYSVRCIAQ